MTAGRRNQYIGLQRFTSTLDGAGQEVRTWETIGNEWGAVFYGRGDERRTAAMEGGQQPATFQFLRNDLTDSLTLKDRIDHAGEWDIVGIAPDFPKSGDIEFTAVRRL